jgi:EAL domain-containing protein (putative c-di-GMP-specific phosphodiesterase class I)
MAAESSDQPKVRIADGGAAGLEALMRWIRDGRPVASPDVFIPLAEEASLIHNTTWYSLSNSLRMAAHNDGLGVAVNITPGMLHHREFLEMVSSAVSTWNVRPGGLTLEITEGSLIDRRLREGKRAVDSVARSGGTHLGRRFRHRVLFTELLQEDPGRRAQDRQVICDAHAAR